MKQVRITFDVDCETGDYDVAFKNVSNPGEMMDLVPILVILKRVMDNVVKKENLKLENSPDERLN